MKPSHEWFDSLVMETKGALANYLRRYLSSADDIQDVLQDAHLKVLCLLRKQRHRDHEPGAFLYTTIRNPTLSLWYRQVVVRSNGAVTT